MSKSDTPDAIASASLAPGEHNPFVNQQLHVARTLADEREDILKRVGANRDVLRNMALMGYLDAEQRDAIEAFYPTRERTPRKGKDENATFANKEVAKNTPAAA